VCRSSSEFQFLEFVNRVEVLSARHSEAAFHMHAAVPFKILRNGRLFEPVDIVVSKFPCGADGMLDRPSHVGIFSHKQRHDIVSEQHQHRRPAGFANRAGVTEPLRPVVAIDISVKAAAQQTGEKSCGVFLRERQC
jgi:hypothetical protein